MYYGVVLIGDKTNLCIPAAWVYCLDVVRAFNVGVNRNEKKRIFFSKNLKRTPNFLLPLRSSFEPNEDGCYLVKIKSTFYTMDGAQKCMGKLRGGLPAVYSEMRVEKPPSFLNGEAQITEEVLRQNIVKTEIKTEVDNRLVPLRKAIVALNDALPPVDLTICESDVIILTDSGDDSDGENEDISIASDDSVPYDCGEMVNSKWNFAFYGKNMPILCIILFQCDATSTQTIIASSLGGKSNETNCISPVNSFKLCAS